mmetsp:Transcript_14914/g.36503  ORF Transcript_14914/g.36503 Transcript_14914/m.36503 type:complete len:202 (-) Transcript_14914:316-921(-)
MISGHIAIETSSSRGCGQAEEGRFGQKEIRLIGPGGWTMKCKGSEKRFGRQRARLNLPNARQTHRPNPKTKHPQRLRTRTDEGPRIILLWQRKQNCRGMLKKQSIWPPKLRFSAMATPSFMLGCFTPMEGMSCRTTPQLFDGSLLHRQMRSQKPTTTLVSATSMERGLPKTRLLDLNTGVLLVRRGTIWLSIALRHATRRG